MTTVFIGGSRHVSRLNDTVRARLDTIMARAFPVLVGDANGADKAVQQYLHSKHYPYVDVFCADGACRNNVGGWKQHEVPTTSRQRDAEFFSAKDRVMAKEATIGLMIWDGKSIGTLLNVYRLLQLGKNAVVYSVPGEQFMEFRWMNQWDQFMERCAHDLQIKVAQRIAGEAPPQRLPAQAALQL